MALAVDDQNYQLSHAAGSGSAAVRCTKKASTRHSTDFTVINHEPKIRALVRTISNSGNRLAAVEDLSKWVHGPEIASLVAAHVRALAPLLRDANVAVRSASLGLFRKVAEEGECSVVAAQLHEIGTCLEDDDVAIRQKAARLCRVLAEGHAASGLTLHIPRLAACVESGDKSLRLAPLEALSVIAEFGEAKAVASNACRAVLCALNDENLPEVRASAFHVLRAIVAAGCEDLLQRGLGDAVFLDMLFKSSTCSDATCRHAAKRTLLTTILEDLCKADKITVKHKQAWLSAFLDQDTREERGVILQMLGRNNARWLRQLHDMLHSKPEVLTRISAIFMEYCREQFAAAVDEDATVCILNFKSVYSALSDLTVASFGHDSLFQRAMDRGIGQILNRDIRCAKQLALFWESYLKTSTRDDHDMMAVFESVIQLLKHLSDKDVFLDMYRHSLSRRLLQKTCASRELEQACISRLALECGDSATRKLTSMLADVALSEQLYEEYCKLSHEGCSEGIQHNVCVLRANVWPGKLASIPIVPCPGLAACALSFERFYASKFKARKLSWIYSMGSAELTTGCFDRRHFLLVSTYQCIILMLFNNQTSWSVEDICGATRIPKEECKRQLASLCLPKHKVLLQDTAGSNVKDDSLFHVNTQFSADRTKVVVAPVKKERSKEKVSKQDVPADRKHALDAIIVRIMKAKKILDHNSLLEEVFKQCLIFKPQPQQIKMQIENLIEREFMCRDGNDRSLYQYVA